MLELRKGERASRDRHNRERWGSGLHWSPEQVGEWRRLRVEDKRDTRDMRRHLLEGLQPLGSDRELETGEAGEMTARVRQILHQTFADRIGHLREHDGYSVTLLPQHRHDWRAVGQDQVRGHPYQLGRVGAQYFGISCPAVFDSEVVAFDP